MEMVDKNIEIVVAVDNRWAIGRGGGLLCHLREDLRHFKALTRGHTVVMGRRTFESLPAGPLPERQNIILTRDRSYAPRRAADNDRVVVAHDIDEALRLASMPEPIMIIGGAQIYRAAMPIARTLHITMIHHAFAGADVWFAPPRATEWTITRVEPHRGEADYDYDFVTYTRL